MGKICRLLTFLFIISDGWVETTNHSNHRLKSRPCGLYMPYNGRSKGSTSTDLPLFWFALKFPPKKKIPVRFFKLPGYVLPQIFMTCELSMMAPLSNSGVTCWISRAFGTKAGKCIGLNMLLCLGRIFLVKMPTNEMCVWLGCWRKWIWYIWICLM